MYRKIWLPGAAALAATMSLGVGTALAQEGDDLSALRAELEAMRQEYDAKIEALEARLEEAEAAANEAKVAAEEASDSSTAVVAARAPVETPAPQSTPQPAPRAAVGANAYNPAISVVLNGTFATYENDPEMAAVPGFSLGEEAGLGSEGFSLGESELALTANVDHKIAGTLIFALTDEGEVEVEEAYIEATSLPGGFTAKAGKIFSGVGYLNEKHSHNWDFIDQPLPYRVFLGNQYGDAGVQVRWIAPLDRFLEFGGEWFAGDNFPAAGGAKHGKGAYAGYVTTGGDLGISSSWLAKFSYLHTEADGRETEADVFSGTDNLAIASFVYKWAPNGNPTIRNLIVNGEYMFGTEKGDFNGVPIDMDRTGWYAQAVYQFRPNWRAGLRYAGISTDAPPLALMGSTLDNLGRSPDAFSALLEYDTSEFSRFRLMYTYDDADFMPNNEFIARYTVIFGPHGGHRF